MRRNVELTCGEIEAKRAEILKYFTQSFELFEAVFDCLANDDVFYERPEKRRHQLIFYFGHTAVFYINKLILGKFLNERVNPKFESIFAIGVDEMAWDDLQTKNFQWPSVNEVRSYRNKIKHLISDFIQNVTFELPITWNSPMWTIMMGIEHERIHIETSSVLHRQLDLKFIKNTDFWNTKISYANPKKNELLDVLGGTICIGKTLQDRFYGWDNEYGNKCFDVTNFKASKFLVSNGEFLDFIKDGGYLNDDFWDAEGKNWKNHEQISLPVFWSVENGEYFYRTLSQKFPLPLNYPVDVNYLEAKAFCNWKSKKTGTKITLPSEAMWHLILKKINKQDDIYISETIAANINLEYDKSSCAIDKFQQGEFCDIIGNVWQWTSTPIDGLNGFEIHPLYDDFSTPTFDGKHNIIKGGSWISTGNLTLSQSRYAFRRHFYQHAGFRYVEVNEDYVETFEYFEKDPEVISKINEQYKTKNLFYKTISDKLSSFLNDKNISKAAVFGCGTGRMCFEISNYTKRVFGLDFSARFINVCDQLKKNFELKYDDSILKLSDVNLKNVDMTKIEFWQADICNLKPTFDGFDFIFGHDIFTNLYNKKKFWEILPLRMKENSYAIFSYKNIFDIDFPEQFDLNDKYEIDEFTFIVLRKK
jgi:5-histidylcysteine sulfoxide synthase